MDGARFDSIARTLAGRLSRRSALRGTGAGVAAGLFAVLQSEPGRAAVMHQTATLPYVVVRHYSPSASASDLQQALGQYAMQLAQQPGFIEYTVLSDDAGLTTISIFDSQDDEAAAANQLATWIAQNLGSL
jgi:quinol monooxygenase YgiN